MGRGWAVTDYYESLFIYLRQIPYHYIRGANTSLTNLRSDELTHLSLSHMDMEAEKRRLAVLDTEQGITYSAGEGRAISCSIFTRYICAREEKRETKKKCVN